MPNGFPKAFGQVGFAILVWPTIAENPGRDYPKYTIRDQLGIFKYNKVKYTFKIKRITAPLTLKNHISII